MKLPRMIRNLWIYRRLLLLAVLLGVALYFVMINREPLRVSFPFVGDISSSSGVVMLVSAALGAVVSWLIGTFRQAFREARRDPSEPGSVERVEQREPPAGA